MNRFFVILIFVIGIVGYANSKHLFQPAVQFGVFYSSLANHGEWIDSDYGYAWRPMHVSHGWRPYLHGRWVWTDYGWYWVSNEPFGWATFHYGRWNYDDYYGWIWIPDNEWGPAWVEWCYNDNYIGWAPLSSYAIFSVNIGITFSNHWVTPVHYWNFIPGRYFTATHPVDYVQPLDRNKRIYGETRHVNHIQYEHNRVINRGIDVNIVERQTNNRIGRIDVVTRDRGEGERMVRDAGRERIEAYRPRIENRGHNEQPLPTDNRYEKQNTERRRAIQQPDRNSSSFNRDAERSRNNIREQIPSEQRSGVNPGERSSLPRQRNESSIQRQEQQREQLQRKQENQRMREQQMRENRSRETPRYEKPAPQTREKPQPQVRERTQPSQQPSDRHEQSRENSERRRKP